MSLRVRAITLLGLASTLGLCFAQESGPALRGGAAKSVLLIVDAQVGVVSTLWESQRLVAKLEQLVSKARSASVPIVWVQHADAELKHGSDDWKLLPQFSPAPTEVVVHKQYNSSFAGTHLDRQLRAMGATRIVLAGAATNWCIRSTAYAAVDRGYDLALVSDAHSTEAIRLPDGKMVSAEAIVADLNTVFRYLTAPGVRTQVASTAEVAF